MSIQLCASQLFCKHGFRDGDLLDNIMYDHPELEKADSGIYDSNNYRITYFDNFCLMALCELYLLPLCPKPMTLYLASYSHNGCRVKEPEDDRVLWREVSICYQGVDMDSIQVEIPEATVVEIMTAMAKTFEALLAGKPVVFPSILKLTAEALAEEFKHTDIPFDASICISDNPLLMGPK